ncbi:hypothetical protein ESZ36_17175 [Colwellia demingiae]|uniref:NERD domain-containing protein n=1 Tax=Colwellia demingiae TaxID=89401 RepID=A0A5C6Q967_9GAMM|nr:hypothetical protein [Colwellia demingiae]TWX65536.1 hypothetical protein ESZ36_17175 [Colwellia demingiae]
MNNLEKILEQEGPTSSSKIVDRLVSIYKISKPAARKRVSRGSPNIVSLKGISLPRREKFVYLKKDFGSPQYWNNLISVLQETNSAYGLALGALTQRGEIVLKNHFSIICGAPLRQAKHLAPDTILKNLVAAKLVSIIDISGVGECVALTKGSDVYYESLIPHFKARMITENILLNGIGAWVKNIGLGSYGKILLRNEVNDVQPRVGTFHWDLTAPSYLGALTTLTLKGAPNKLGFIACDICLGKRISEKGLAPFLYKCNTLRSLKNVGRCLQIFVADRFEKDAFIKAKENGILPITPENLFGKDVSEGLNYLISALSGLADLMFEPEMFDEMFTRLSKIEGAVNNLRGAFFEFIVAEIFRKKAIDVRMNYILKTSLGERAEADIVVNSLEQLLFIECKGYSPHATVPDSEVKKWLTERVPRTVKAANEHTDWKDKIPTLEFWTTGKLSESAIQMIELAMKTVKPTRYKLGYKDVLVVQRAIRVTKDNGLISSFEKNYIKDPISSIKLKRPKFDSTMRFNDELVINETSS